MAKSSIRASAQQSISPVQSAQSDALARVAQALDAGIIEIDRAGGGGLVTLSITVYSKTQQDTQKSIMEFVNAGGESVSLFGQDFIEARALLVGALATEIQHERRAWDGRIQIEYPAGYGFSTRIHDDYVDIEVTFDVARCDAAWLLEQMALFERLAFEVDGMIEYIQARPQWFPLRGTLTHREAHE